MDFRGSSDPRSPKPARKPLPASLTRLLEDPLPALDAARNLERDYEQDYLRVLAATWARLDHLAHLIEIVALPLQGSRPTARRV
jgi:hypothetical protein